MIDEKLIERLIGNGLSIEEYLILSLIYQGKFELLESYEKNVGVSDHVDLILREVYLNLNLKTPPKVNVKFEQEFKEFLVAKFDSEAFEKLFIELKEHYPAKVITKTKATRRLHNDKAKCKKLYAKILTKSNGELDYEKHNHILKCIDFEVKERIKGGNEEYWQLMGSYLHQRSWELVEEDLDKSGSTIPKENTNYDVI